MRTIDLDEDVYQHLLLNAQEIGESGSSILRRLLGLGGGGSAARAQAGEHELCDVLSSPKFRVDWPVVNKFLYLLRAVHGQHKADFERVLEIKGRERVYFAKSREEIEGSGASTQPREIYQTGYWVMTNSPTPQKRQLLRDVLKMLKYSPAAIAAASSALR